MADMTNRANSAYWAAQQRGAKSWRVNYEALFDMFAGARLGRGMSREVFAYEGPFVPAGQRFVLKVERHPESKHFQNITEWLIWSNVDHIKRIHQHLAPCVMISPCGRFLIQQRTDPASPKDFPKRIPEFWGDLKRSNFGLLGGRLVCHDYGTAAWNMQDFSTKPKTAKWTD